MEARSLVQQVRDIKNSTNITQERVVDELSIVQDIIEDTREQIAKVYKTCICWPRCDHEN